MAQNVRPGIIGLSVGILGFVFEKASQYLLELGVSGHGTILESGARRMDSTDGALASGHASIGWPLPGGQGPEAGPGAKGQGPANDQWHEGFERLAESYGISAKPINVAQTYRLYLRCWTDKASVLAAVGANNPENSIWRYFGAKFAAIGLPVPIFYYSNIIFDEEHKNFVNLAIIEDCGNESLVAFAQRQVSSGAIVDAYKDAADTLACWHSRGLAAFDSPHELQLPHSFQMVRDVLWKRFTDNYGLLGLPVPFPSPGIMAEGLELCRKVEFEGMGKVLLHNEYQGRNLLMSRSGLKAIDWAGARMGPAICDLASLLYDPEVSLSHEAKAEIVETYFKVMGAKAEIGPFMRDMGLTALMWLLCLFGNNAYKFGRIHIQSAVGCLKPIMARLREIAAFLGPIGCPSIYRLIDDTLAGLDSVFPPTENNQGQGLNS